MTDQLSDQELKEVDTAVTTVVRCAARLVVGGFSRAQALDSIREAINVNAAPELNYIVNGYDTDGFLSGVRSIEQRRANFLRLVKRRAG